MKMMVTVRDYFYNLAGNLLRKQMDEFEKLKEVIIQRKRQDTSFQEIDIKGADQITKERLTAGTGKFNRRIYDIIDQRIRYSGNLKTELTGTVNTMKNLHNKIEIMPDEDFNKECVSLMIEANKFNDILSTLDKINSAFPTLQKNTTKQTVQLLLKNIVKLEPSKNMNDIKEAIK